MRIAKLGVVVVVLLGMAGAAAADMGLPPAAYAPDRHGFTFEANLGVGSLHFSSDGTTDDERSLAGLSLSFGGWLTPRLVLSGRIAGVTDVENGGRITDAFVGPSLQYWVTPQFWIGGGIGIGIISASVNNGGPTESENGFGLDLRIGYTFFESGPHSLNVSLEINPSFISESGTSATFTGIGLLFGYQYL